MRVDTRLNIKRYYVRNSQSGTHWIVNGERQEKTDYLIGIFRDEDAAYQIIELLNQSLELLNRAESIKEDNVRRFRR